MNGACRPARSCRPASAFTMFEFWYGFVIAVILMLLARAFRLF